MTEYHKKIAQEPSSPVSYLITTIIVHQKSELMCKYIKNMTIGLVHVHPSVSTCDSYTLFSYF